MAVGTTGKRIGPYKLTGSYTTVGGYTVPASKQFHAKEIRVINLDTGAAMGLYLNLDATDDTSLYPPGVAIDASGMMVDDCHLVLGAGELFKAKGSTTNKLIITIDGVETDA